MSGSRPPSRLLWPSGGHGPLTQSRNVNIGVASNDHLVLSAQTACRGVHLDVVPERRTPWPGELPACGRCTLMSVTPSLSVPISRAATFPETISVKLSALCSATYLQLTAVRMPPLPRGGTCLHLGAAQIWHVLPE